MAKPVYLCIRPDRLDEERFPVPAKDQPPSACHDPFDPPAKPDGDNARVDKQAYPQKLQERGN